MTKWDKPLMKHYAQHTIGKETRIRLFAGIVRITCRLGRVQFLWPHGPLTRYAILRVAHAPGMPGKFSSPPRVSDHDMHHGTCVTHAPWCMPGSLTTGSLWSRRWGKRSRHSRRMRNPPFWVSDKRPLRDVAWSKLTLQIAMPSSLPCT